MKLIKNSIVYSIVLILKNGIGFLLLPLYTVYLTTAEYGMVSLITSLVQFVSIFVLLSLNGAGMRYHYEFKHQLEKRRTLWGTVYSTVLLNAILFALIFSLGHRYLLEPFLGNIPFYPYLLAGILTCVFQAGYQIYQTYLKAEQLGKDSGILDLSHFLFNLVLTVVLVVAFDLKVMGVIFALLIANAVFGLISFLMFRSKIKLGIDRRQLGVSLRYSLPLLPHALAGWMMTLIDRIFLNNLADISEVGIYTIGFQVANIIHVFMVTINQAYSPWFFEKSTEGEEGRKKIREYAEVFVLFFSVVGLGCVYFSPEVLRLITTKSYHAGWVVTPFLVYAFVSRSVYYMVIGPVFLKRTSLVSIITFSGALLNTGLNALLVGPYGKVGAAVASLIAMFVTSVMAVILSRKVNDFGYRWGRMYLFVLGGFALSLVVFLSGSLGAFQVALLKIAIMLVILTVLYIIYARRLKGIYLIWRDRGAEG